MTRAPQAVAAIALALLLSATLPEGSGQGQVNSPVDLEVLSVEVVAAPTWIHGVATNGAVRAVVHNRGSTSATGYQVNYFWVDGAGQVGLLNEAANEAGQPDNGRSADVGDKVLARDGTADQDGDGWPDDRRAHTLNWRLQPHQSGPGHVRVVVQLNGDTNAANDVRQAAFHIDVRQLQFAAASPGRNVHPDETVFIRYALSNLGNVVESVAVEARPSPSPGASRLTTSLDVSALSVPPGQVRTATLYVTYPYKGNDQPLNVQFPLRVTTAYGHALDALSADTRNVDDPYGPDDFRVNITGTQAAPRYVVPGHAHDFSLVVRNAGSAPDTYVLAAEVDSGWLALASPTRLALEVGESAVVNVRVTPPAQLPPGSVAHLRVNVASDHPVPPFAATQELRVSGPIPQILQVAPPRDAYLGDTGHLDVHLANHGDVDVPAGSNLSLELRFGNGATRQLHHLLGAVGAGNVRAFNVSMGSLDVRGALHYSLHWQGIGTPPSPFNGTMRVRDPRIVLSAAASLQGIPGELVPYRVAPYLFQVQNDGADAEWVRLRAETGLGVAQVQGDLLLLQPGEIRSVPISHALPRPAGPDNRTFLRLAAEIEGRPTFSWSVSTTTFIRDSMGPQIRMDVLRSDWDVNRPLPVRAMVTDEGALAAVRLLLRLPDGSTQTLGLNEVGGELWEGLAVMSTNGTYTLRVVAVDAAGNQAEGPAWSVRASMRPVPRIDIQAPEGVWDAGRPLNVSVSSVHRVDLLRYTLQREGRTIAQGEVPVRGGHAAVSINDSHEGEAVLVLQVTDAAGTPAESTFTLQLKAAVPGAPPPSSGGPPASPRRLPEPALLVLAACVAAVAAWRRRA